MIKLYTRESNFFRRSARFILMTPKPGRAASDKLYTLRNKKISLVMDDLSEASWLDVKLNRIS